MADFGPDCICWCQVRPIVCTLSGCGCIVHDHRLLTPSADLPACRDEDPAFLAALAAAFGDPPEYQHPEDEEGARLAERDTYIGTWSNIDITKRRPDDGV